jgi:hypothetical protein
MTKSKRLAGVAAFHHRGGPFFGSPSQVFVQMLHRPGGEPANSRRNLSRWQYPEEAHMPAIIIPVLWVGGAAILLGGGWYVIGHMVH